MTVKSLQVEMDQVKKDVGLQWGRLEKQGDQINEALNQNSLSLQKLDSYMDYSNLRFKGVEDDMEGVKAQADKNEHFRIRVTAYAAGVMLVIGLVWKGISLLT